MTATTTTAVLVPIQPAFTDPERLPALSSLPPPRALIGRARTYLRLWHRPLSWPLVTCCDELPRLRFGLSAQLLGLAAGPALRVSARPGGAR